VDTGVLAVVVKGSGAAAERGAVNKTSARLECVRVEEYVSLVAMAVEG
jgi:hypothetical protein